MARIVFALLSIMLAAANAFVVPVTQTHSRMRVPIVRQSALDDVRECTKSGRRKWSAVDGTSQKQCWKPSRLALGTRHGNGNRLLTMGLTGAWLGWQIRLGKGEQLTSMGDTVREHHPKVMSGVFLLFIVGAVLGISALHAQGQHILESPHARTAAVVLSLFALQAVLPNFFASRRNARTVHAYLGSATMVTILVHIINGIRLGNSF